jgi:hypothetical protein
MLLVDKKNAPIAKRSESHFRTFDDLIFLPLGSRHMLIIRQNQMDVFRKLALAQFEEAMLAHSKSFSPHLCEVIGDDQLRTVVRTALDRAGRYKFTNRGPLRLFIELGFLFGSGFADDPQYPWASEILRSTDGQMCRAEKLHAKSTEYLEIVSGPDNHYTNQALERLSVAARERRHRPLPARDQFGITMLQEMARIFPQKSEYVGHDALEALISEGVAEAARHRLPSVLGEGLVVILMFAFGHGCTQDPLYPWISRTLNDQMTVDPADRADRLEKKALIWLDHVIARNRGARR